MFLEGIRYRYIYEMFGTSVVLQQCACYFGSIYHMLLLAAVDTSTTLCWEEKNKSISIYLQTSQVTIYRTRAIRPRSVYSFFHSFVSRKELCSTSMHALVPSWHSGHSNINVTRLFLQLICLDNEKPMNFLFQITSLFPWIQLQRYPRQMHRQCLCFSNRRRSISSNRCIHCFES